MTGITYKANSEKSKNNIQTTCKNAFPWFEYDLTISTRQKTCTYFKNLSEKGYFSSQAQIVTGIT